MYLPTENPLSDALPSSVSRPSYAPEEVGTASAFGTSYARQSLRSQTSVPTTATAIAAATTTTTTTTTSTLSFPSSVADASYTAWYARSWVVPVAWALAFYCVASMLMLCALYGQGILDAKLNYVPRRDRASRAAALRTPHSPWDNSDDDDDDEETSHRQTRAMTGREEAVMAEHREDALREVLLEQMLREREWDRARSENEDSVRDGAESVRESARDVAGRRDMRTLADRLQSERVERALAAAGVL